MAIEYFGQPYWYTLTLEICNYIFAAIFFIEMILKLTALSRTYFTEAWNVFDFVIVWGSVMGISLKIIFKVQIGSIGEFLYLKIIIYR